METKLVQIILPQSANIRNYQHFITFYKHLIPSQIQNNPRENQYFLLSDATRKAIYSSLYMNKEDDNPFFKLYPKINLNSTFGEPGINPVFLFNHLIPDLQFLTRIA